MNNIEHCLQASSSTAKAQTRVATLAAQERDLRVQLQCMQSEAATLVGKLHGGGVHAGGAATSELQPGEGAAELDGFWTENAGLRLEIRTLHEAASAFMPPLFLQWNFASLNKAIASAAA